LLLAPLFTGLYCVAYPLYYYELKARRILLISILLSIANLILSVISIRKWGAMGGAVSFMLLAVMTAWLYLAIYRQWAHGMRILPMMIGILTVLVFMDMTLLLSTGSVPLFSLALLATSAVMWVMGRKLALPLLYGLGQKLSHEPPASR
jgi:O-antigen/teichoic acid export membrane protein